MTTLTIRNLPAEIRTRLKARAAWHRRSLNTEVLACLEAAVASARVDTAALTADARDVHVRVAGHLTDGVLAELKNAGRT